MKQVGERLCADTLVQLPARVQRPQYPLRNAAVGVVHLGVGNFFRAHQAAYLEQAMNGGAVGWGVCGISLRSAATRDALLEQDNYYALVERGADGDRARVIGSLREILVAPEDPAKVIARMAAPGTRWITLTITEKGYGHIGGGSGLLDVTHADIAHDIAHPRNPRGAVGLLHAAIRARRLDNAGPLTVLSCDNLSCNGDLLRGLVLGFDRAVNGGSSGWIEDQLRFPNTMVDRIVPRTTPAQRCLARDLLGLEDAWPVVTEPFSQWVVEDRFAGPRPPLEDYGVQIVADVRPFEAMKLQLLNAAHSALAWLAVPAGLSTVDEAIAEPSIRGFVEALWRVEVVPGLDPGVTAAAPGYCASLLARFANPGLAHQTAQIAMDGSQKLPLRVLPSIRTNLLLRLPTDRLALVVAAWINYLGGVDDAGACFEPDDPMRERLHALARVQDSAEAVRGVMREEKVFGDLGECDVLLEKVDVWLQRLRRHGGVNTLRTWPQ